MHIVTEKAKHFCGDPELLARRMTCRGVPGCSVALLQGGTGDPFRCQRRCRRRSGDGGYPL